MTGVHRDRGAPISVPVWLLLLADGILLAASGVVFPLLPEIQDRHHLPTWSLGVISGASFAAGIVAVILISPLADRGHAKQLLIGGMGLGVIALLAFPIATTVLQLVAARALEGVAVGMVSPAVRATLVALDPSRAGERLARVAAVETAGFTLAPVLGAGLASIGGLALPFVVLAIALLICALLISQRCPTIPARADADSPRLAFGLVRLRPVRVALLLSVVLWLPLGTYDTLWARYLEDRGATAVFVGITLSLYGVPFAIASGWGGRLVDRIGPMRAVTRAMIVVVPMVAFYGRLAQLWAIGALSLVEATANAVAFPAASTAMARACPPDQLAAGQGLASAASQLAAGAASFAAAPAYASFGSERTFGGVAIVMAAVVVAAMVMNRTTQSPDGPIVAP